MHTPSRLLLIPVLLAIFLLLQSCFPTKPEESNNNPKDPDPVFTENPSTDDPNTLPTGGDPTIKVSEATIDSLFQVLVQRVESLESVESPHDIFNTDFESLRKGFATAITGNPSQSKANVGYIVSAVCALNTSSSIKKMVDSMDSYIQAVDDYYGYDEPVFGSSSEIINSSPVLALTKRQLTDRHTALNKKSSSNSIIVSTFKRQGVEGLGRVLLVQAPKILLAQTQKPSFPAFLTISFIQDIVENEIIPRLNEIVSACIRLENSNISLELKAFEETFELDAGDIYLFEASIHLLRAGLGYFTAYEMDIYSPDGSNTMRWIDDFYGLESKSHRILRIKGDTLVETYFYDNSQIMTKFSDIMTFNMKRPTFLKLRRDKHNAVYTDLKIVPPLIKAGLTKMKSETDDQSNDLIAAGDIFDLDADMAEFSADMVSEGFSTSLAKKFKSPESLMDFITEILTSEYTFSEVIDEYNITMTVNLSNWFTNPVQDLKSLFPKYRFTQGNERFFSSVDTYFISPYTSNTINVYDGDSVDIPASFASDTTYQTEYKVITLTQNYSYRISIDSAVYYLPMVLVDDAGKDIPLNQFENIFDDKTALQICFPYFSDYTFNGVFPRMSTRKSWLDFLIQFYE